jgi:rhamnulokinase
VSHAAATDLAVVAAVDIGASSGRVILGRVDAEQAQLEEVHRFPNDPVRLPDGLHWDVLRIYQEILAGLRKAGEAAGDEPVRSVGIDSWAIDYGLVDAGGELLYQPFHYRDERNNAVVDSVHALVSPEALYARTGLQFLPFNTIYQLAASRRSPGFGAAAAVLLMPDLLAYWLTGVQGAERTNASTTGLLDARTRAWATDLAHSVGLRAGILPALRDPGDVLGPLTDTVRDTTALRHDTSVILVGSHDTASAVVGVPAADRRFAYIACGTWSLVGVETDEPILSEASRAANFTNEAGVDGRVRYLRNVMGLWLLQESMRRWAQEGSAEDLGSLLAAAARLPATGPTFDPDDAVFLPPGDMPARIVAACRARGAAPETRPQIVRSIVDSLALAYARTLADAVRLSGAEVDVVHLVGGGAQNELLCQLTADACALPVMAGPTEATALGNVLVQARALAVVHGDLEALRAVARRSSITRRYEPRQTQGAAA